MKHIVVGGYKLIALIILWLVLLIWHFKFFSIDDTITIWNKFGEWIVDNAAAMYLITCCLIALFTVVYCALH